MLISAAVSFLGTGAGGLLQVDGPTFYGSSATSQQLTDLLNLSLDRLCPLMRLFGYGAVDLTQDDGDGVIDLTDVAASGETATKHFYEPRYVTLNGARLLGPDGRAGIWEYGEFLDRFPNWRDADAGATAYAVWMQEDRLVLYPRPDSTYEAYTCYVDGFYKPRPLVYANDSALHIKSFGVPQRAEMAVVEYAAVIGMNPLATHQEAFDLLGQFRASSREAVQAVIDTNSKMALGTYHWEGAPTHVVIG